MSQVFLPRTQKMFFVTLLRALVLPVISSTLSQPNTAVETVANGGNVLIPIQLTGSCLFELIEVIWNQLVVCIHSIEKAF